MRWSQTFIPTLKEAPREAEVASHKLMLRSGMIQNLSSGLYIYLPLGYRVIEKIKNIIRECLNEKGAIELNMPALQPRAIWERSGRWDALADLMMRIKDREDKEFVLGPTHEEIITDLVAKRVQSYRELPLNFYQIQTKFRDEIRPRFGVIRAKEFIMKDGYSFDLTHEDTLQSYQLMVEAYFKIFKGLGLPVMAVEADTGAMGDGGKSQEFIAPTPIGEDVVAACPSCGYAANLEMAGRRPFPAKDCSPAGSALEKVSTPGVRTIEEVARFFDTTPAALIKALVYQADGQPVMVLIRGDLDVNEIKLKRALACTDLQLAEDHQIEAFTGAPVGFAGPIGLQSGSRVVCDLSVATIKNGVTGANEADAHYRGVTPGEDFSMDGPVDIGNVTEGDGCPSCGAVLNLSRGIEVGHVFCLGKKYSEKLGATAVDAEGREVVLDMGCYGIGVSRLAAAIVEAHHDAKGICWPVTVAPYEVVLTVLDMGDPTISSYALELYASLKEQGVDVLLDDRDQRPGFKFKDAELIGFPLRITVGQKTLGQGLVETFVRHSGNKGTLDKNSAAGEIPRMLDELRREIIQ